MDIISDKIVKTRKKHMCSACGRVFDKGIQMRTQVNTFDGIITWRECPTCTELLSTYRSEFADNDDICHVNCVNEVCTKRQTPEQLLQQFQNDSHEKSKSV